MCICFKCHWLIRFLSKTSPSVTVSWLKLTKRLRSYYYKMKEMNKTYSSHQHFMGRWNNIDRWVIVPAGLPLQLLQDGLNVHLSKLLKEVKFIKEL